MTWEKQYNIWYNDRGKSLAPKDSTGVDLVSNSKTTGQ